MPRYGVEIHFDPVYVELEAEDQDEAIQEAFDIAERHIGSYFWELGPDCDYCIDLDEE